MDKVKSILKKIDSITMGTLNLEIQVAQLDTPASRGAMVATEHIKKEIEELKALVNQIDN